MAQLNRPLVVSFSDAGHQIGTRIAKHLQAEYWRQAASRPGDGKVMVQAAFGARRPIVGVCASAILIRLLAPVLDSKLNEPPVLAVSSDGRAIVPLLGGHHGANRIAQDLADMLDGFAAVTTASDRQTGIALDELPNGYMLANPERAKPSMAALMAGKKIRLSGDAPWLQETGLVARDGVIEVAVSTKLQPAHVLHIVPKSLIVGVGCERHVSAGHVTDLIVNTLRDNRLAPHAIAAIASIDIKADEPALHAAARHFNVPLRTFTASELAQESHHVPNPSAVVQAEVGTPSVAEAAAIKAGALLVAKQKSQQATCAIGFSAKPVNVDAFGHATGALFLVGLGPGANCLRTIAAEHALRHATDWVGYDLYLDLAADARTCQTEHRFALGEEEKRVRHALELAGSGKKVALVCSGDAGIFAMGALVFELLHAEGARRLSAAARRVQVETFAGISAFQAAAARSGALVGHDFCCISLSDLLTPRDDIVKRLDAAIAGDFVTAFYNPRSKRRTDLLEIAQQKFLAARPGDTPVVVASSLGRPAEKVKVTTLRAFRPDEIDMLTIVMFGASQSRSFIRGSGETVAYTPRGYAEKMERTETNS